MRMNSVSYTHLDVYKRQEEKAQPATPQTIQSSAAAYRDLNATLGNFSPLLK